MQMSTYGVKNVETANLTKTAMYSLQNVNKGVLVMYTSQVLPNKKLNIWET